MLVSTHQLESIYTQLLITQTLIIKDFHVIWSRGFEQNCIPEFHQKCASFSRPTPPLVVFHMGGGGGEV